MFTSLIVSLIAFIVAVAVLVVVHEWGHFLTARCCGVKVVRFSIGLGKPLWRRWDRHGTEFVIAVFPIGGYVKLLDEDEDNVKPHELSKTLNRQSLWKKISIVLAGPVSNLLFAFFAYWILFSVGIESLAPIVGKVHGGSPASYAQFHQGERIIAVDDQPTRNWQDVAVSLLSHGEKQTQATFIVEEDHLTNPTTKLVTFPSGAVTKSKGDLFELLGIEPYFPPLPPEVGQVLNHSPAKEAGFQENDRVVAVQGNSITDWNDFVGFVRQHPERTFTVEIERQGKPLTLSVHTRAQEIAPGEVQGYIGLMSKPFDWPKEFIQKEQYPVWVAPLPAFKKTMEMSLISLKILGRMLLGEVSVKNLSGPIGVAQGAGESALLGLKAYLSYLALISISLGILNALPIPVLDGGRFLYYLIELIFRRPLPKAVQEAGLKLGVMLLIAVVLVAFYNDISRLL